MKSTSTILLLLLCIGIISSCVNNSKEAIEEELGLCDTTDISFQNEIKPIIEQFCSTSGCHNNTSIAGGYNLDGYDNIKNVALGNRFLGSIRHETGFSHMPKGTDKLTDCQIQQIEIWIADGAPNN